MPPITFRPFRKEDWYGHASCSCFPDGNLPLISETPITVEGTDAYIVLDADGMSVFFGEGLDDPGEQVIFTDPYTHRAVAMMRPKMSRAELVSMSGAEVM